MINIKRKEIKEQLKKHNEKARMKYALLAGQ
jgi:sRNA-binding carbon storage regulator CsrA